MEIKCPTCKKTLPDLKLKKNKLPEYFPFCCKRCQLLDFGAWIDEDYRIEANKDEPEDELLEYPEQ